MSAAISGDKPKARMSLPPTLLELRRTSRSSGLRSLQPRLQRQRDPKRPEAFDIGKPLGGFARGQRQDRGRDFAADQAVDRAGFCFAELDFHGTRRHERGADASARGGLLLLDGNVLVVQVG